MGSEAAVAGKSAAIEGRSRSLLRFADGKSAVAAGRSRSKPVADGFDFAAPRLATGRAGGTDGRSRSRSPKETDSVAGAGGAGFGVTTVGAALAGGRGGDFLAAGKSADTGFAPGKLAEMTGRSGSSSDPSDAGKSDGTGARGDAGIGGAAGFVTRNECPHFGHRIFRPVAGTRRSSIWYGALHDSHSTWSIRPTQRNTEGFVHTHRGWMGGLRPYRSSVTLRRRRPALGRAGASLGGSL